MGSARKEFAGADEALTKTLDTAQLPRIKEGGSFAALVAHDVSGRIAVRVAKEVPQLMCEDVGSRQGGQDDKVPEAATAGGAPVYASKEAALDVNVSHRAHDEYVDVPTFGVDEGTQAVSIRAGDEICRDVVVCVHIHAVEVNLSRPKDGVCSLSMSFNPLLRDNRDPIDRRDFDVE
ncbi:MAG: hypothetical protein ACI9KE_002324 [Polyangiales bacterium]|jgi:hypothetical protein